MTAHDRIRAFLDAEHSRQVGFLAELVQVPTDNPPGDCVHHADETAARLRALGLNVERYRVPDAAASGAGMVAVTNLVVRHRFGDGLTIALNAHGDAVPPGTGWAYDPYGATVVDGRMYGRGVAVSKSDFATYAYALLALRESGARLRGSVELHFTYDEEAGGTIGPKWLLDQGLTRPDYAIAAGFSYGVAIAHKGCLHLETRVQGRQAHAALPQTGADALEAAVDILRSLYARRPDFARQQSAVPGIGSPTLVVGVIRGGINTNVVPDEVVFRIDRRFIPEEDGARVEEQLTGWIREAARAYPVWCDVRRVLLAEPLVPLPGHETLVSLLGKYGTQVMGVPVGPHGLPLYTDARHYAQAGIPTVLYGAGPRSITEANAHGANEHLALSDLRKATEIVALALFDLLGGAE
jgi:succinyl-diaminopimelate desuccinylase